MPEPSVIAMLEAALCSAAPEKRAAALDQVADLFVAGANRYTDAQIALFDEVFLKLSTEIEVKARRKLARLLAPLPRAPKATMAQLARDPLATVAAPVLIECLQLEDSDIIAIATTGSEGHRFALSRRPDLDESLTDILVERGGRRVARSVAGNEGARHSDITFGKLVQRAARDDVLARAVGTRRDIPRRRFVELLLTASSSVRVELASAAPFAAREIEEAVAEAIVGISREARIVPQDLELAKAEIQRLCRAARSGDVDIHAAARARKFDQSARALSLVCRVPFDVAEHALVEDKPDLLLILAKAAGCSWKTTKSLLRIRAGDKAPLAEDLQQARKDFEQLQRKSASRVIEHFRARQHGEVGAPNPGRGLRTSR